ncbi:hypothetical protein EYZ11_008448 [Aspergillus tanneri]|uniref:Homeobox domain-containing protein n=1 Tax=Aspergillus tanneri TaxID=1220188 RepID=A0A4S3JAW7_9EURO|nr:uncharacterized protein ATNIH1004_007748 [Aspergillus tanneri]KAA8646321.1 hypothetical protein ATNIH1004_007748 [Aspergillus tanneri]THC92095.1 hypothetical protein EYZ11_008448 [Aspergillus tanneri]
MSDPEPSVAACSSPPSTAQASESAAAAAAALNYAFLVHSQKTLTQNLPPRVDNKLLARQKRRRTSPEDHAILEAEYQHNPKPDKAARGDIVKRVSLGEKEVQIWFQNRRQNDRRKSKPLQPHELLAPRSTAADASKNSSSDDNLNVEPGSSSGTDQYEDSGNEQNPTDRSPNIGSSERDIGHGDKDEIEQLRPNSQTIVESSEAHEYSQQVVDEMAPKPESTIQTQQSLEAEELPPNSAKRKRSVSELREGQPVVQQPITPSGVSDARSPPSLRISLSFDGEAMVRKEGELTPSPPKGRNALRIAMSSDGKAVIRAEGEPSPSKNRISMFSTRKPRFPSLRRSNSAVVLGTPRGSAEREGLFGRSRDPRNWESFFDTDARSALSTPSSSQSAPNSNSPGDFRPGAPRSLTRSVSARHRNSMTSIQSEYLNTPIPQTLREKRRKISRTVSSLGRLESSQNIASNRTALVPAMNSKLAPSNAKNDDPDLQCGDSDKENWIPGTRVSHIRRRAASHHHSQRPVLRDSKGRDGKANKGLLAAGKRSRLSQASQRKASGGNGKAAPEMDADVSAFMAGGGSASQEEDLDCIQGLLSLSQGAWR